MQRSSLIGREHELEAAGRLLAECRLFTVTGPPERRPSVFPHIRLFRNEPDIRYRYAVYDQVAPSVAAHARDTGLVVSTSPLCVVHDPGGADARSRKRDRNLRLLRQAVQERADRHVGLHVQHDDMLAVQDAVPGHPGTNFGTTGGFDYRIQALQLGQHHRVLQVVLHPAVLESLDPQRMRQMHHKAGIREQIRNPVPAPRRFDHDTAAFTADSDSLNEPSRFAVVDTDRRHHLPIPVEYHNPTTSPMQVNTHVT